MNSPINMMPKSFVIALIALALLFTSPILAQTAAPTTQRTAGRIGRAAPGPAPSSTQPAIKDASRHAEFVEIAKAGNIDLLFLGDSITDFWRTRGKAAWDQYFAPLQAANFGINADRTQHLLYRLQNGELEGFKAKCIVLMIGTNNLTLPDKPNRNTVSQSADGVKAVVAEIRARQPQAKILLLAVFPRGKEADDVARPLVKQLNQQIATLNDGKHIFYMDIGDKFLTPDGVLTTEMSPDSLHPSAKGYEIWAQAILPKVKELMGSAEQ